MLNNHVYVQEEGTQQAIKNSVISVTCNHWAAKRMQAASIKIRALLSAANDVESDHSNLSVVGSDAKVVLNVNT